MLNGCIGWSPYCPFAATSCEDEEDQGHDDDTEKGECKGTVGKSMARTIFKVAQATQTSAQNRMLGDDRIEEVE